MRHFSQSCLDCIKFPFFCYISCNSIVCIKDISLEHYVLEIIRHIIVPLINHPIYDTLAIDTICPSESCSIVVKAIPYLPSIQVAISEIGVSFVLNGSCFLIQCVLAISGHYDVKRMSCWLCILLGCGASIVRYPILHSCNKGRRTTESNKFGISNTLYWLKCCYSFACSISNAYKVWNGILLNCYFFFSSKITYIRYLCLECYIWFICHINRISLTLQCCCTLGCTAADISKVVDSILLFCKFIRNRLLAHSWC